MQQTTAAPATSATPDFAGLLAALAAVKPAEAPAWNTGDLAEDVATLSYERALHTHARYKVAEAGDAAAMQVGKCEGGELRGAAQNGWPSHPESQAKAPRPTDNIDANPAAFGTNLLERDRKCASITIRMSRTECEQLRKRAAEAGLTVSAYLRSCTFEVECLRAQVKEALAELRKAHDPGKESANEAEKPTANHAVRSAPVHGRRLSWLRRLMPDLHPSQSVVQA